VFAGTTDPYHSYILLSNNFSALLLTFARNKNHKNNKVSCPQSHITFSRV
jgi:hypothetical protein